jgi:hypothetical protein
MMSKYIVALAAACLLATGLSIATAPAFAADAPSADKAAAPADKAPGPTAKKGGKKGKKGQGGSTTPPPK